MIDIDITHSVWAYVAGVELLRIRAGKSNLQFTMPSIVFLLRSTSYVVIISFEFILQ